MSDPEHFSGDLTRKEVQIELDKFIDLLNENNQLKDKIRSLQIKSNPWQKGIHLAKMIDSWRLWSRAFITTYMFLLYYVTIWFMKLENPTLEQSGLISVIVGAGAAWFGLYVKSGPADSD